MLYPLKDTPNQMDEKTNVETLFSENSKINHVIKVENISITELPKRQKIDSDVLVKKINKETKNILKKTIVNYYNFSNKLLPNITNKNISICFEEINKYEMDYYMKTYIIYILDIPMVFQIKILFLIS